jgi:hypothetical protein
LNGGGTEVRQGSVWPVKCCAVGEVWLRVNTVDMFQGLERAEPYCAQLGVLGTVEVIRTSQQAGRGARYTSKMKPFGRRGRRLQKPVRRRCRQGLLINGL